MDKSPITLELTKLTFISWAASCKIVPQLELLVKLIEPFFNERFQDEKDEAKMKELKEAREEFLSAVDSRMDSIINQIWEKIKEEPSY